MTVNRNRATARFFIRPALLAFGIFAAGVSHAAVRKDPPNMGLESTNQPVVQRTDFVLDARTDGYSGLSGEERSRILQWFDAIELGYGDRVAIADGGLGGQGVSNALAELVGRYGLLLADGAPRTAGEAPSGTVRIVVSRSLASVPGCPKWGERYEGGLQSGLTSDYGCTINGNLAAMIANPEDLVQGRQSQSHMRNVTASRAIKAYSDAKPTGNGNTLK